MDRVGGYAGYIALTQDAVAFDDVLIAMHGEADARRIAAMKRRAGG